MKDLKNVPTKDLEKALEQRAKGNDKLNARLGKLIEGFLAKVAVIVAQIQETGGEVDKNYAAYVGGKIKRVGRTKATDTGEPRVTVATAMFEAMNAKAGMSLSEISEATGLEPSKISQELQRFKGVKFDSVARNSWVKLTEAKETSKPKSNKTTKKSTKKASTPAPTAAIAASAGA